jgi:signal transduction histidine kinase/ActR/RegA family two-component response regulator
MGVLTTHPLSLFGLEVFQNSYYIPPEELLTDNVPKVTFRRWVNNIKELKRTQVALISAKEQAVAAARTKDQFLATVSHEIRTPINGVIGMTEVLSQMELRPEQRECVDVIHVSGHHLLTIINDVLDSARIESGKIELAKQPFDLKTCMVEAVRICNPVAAAKGLLILTVMDTCCTENIVGDSTRLRQIMVNLLSNAAKFSQNREITLTATSTHCYEDNTVKLVISVKDCGIGIPSDRLDAIFENFVQADNGITRKYGGTGLGLSISKQLVEMMGGKIHVSSTVGVGSTFTLVIPGIMHASTKASPSMHKRPSCGELEQNGKPYSQFSVLVAEDNVVNQKVIERMLANLGCSFELAKDGEEVIAKSLNKRFDIIFMDIHMPNVDGWMAAEEIKKRVEYPPIIAMTAALFREDDRNRANKLMNGYIQKPLSINKIRETLDKLSSKAESGER